MMLAEAAHDTSDGPLAPFRMSERDRAELWLAGMLHDCGKITTPVHVVDNATKLETIHDRIELVAARSCAASPHAACTIATARNVPCSATTRSRTSPFRTGR